jgi:cyclophilin family peptidyl-prolyl cis-trans isomerase
MKNLIKSIRAKFSQGLLATVLVIAPCAQAIPPAAPSNVQVGRSWFTNYPILAMMVRWQDNSFDEDFFVIQVRVNETDRWVNYASAANNQEYTEFFLNTGLTILRTRVLAVKNITSTVQQSTASQEVVLNISPPVSNNTIVAPTGFTATNLANDDGNMNLAWNDLADNEERYLIQFKTGAEAYRNLPVIPYPWTFSAAGAVPFNFRPFDTRHQLIPETTYTLQLTAARASPRRTVQQGNNTIEIPSFTNYPNLVGQTVSASVTTTITTPALRAPTNLTVTAVDEDTVKLTWTDNSNNEGDFFFWNPDGSVPPDYKRRGGYGVNWSFSGNPGSFFQQYLVGGVEPDPITASRQGEANVFAVPGFTFAWQLKAVHRNGVEGSHVIKESPASNTVTFAPPFNPPTQVRSLVIDEFSATILWKDNSLVETGYVVETKAQGETDFSQAARTSANATQATIQLARGANSQVRVRAIHDSFGVDAYSTGVTINVETRVGITSRRWHPATKDVAISPYIFETGGASPPTLTMTETDLPPGLRFTSVDGLPSSRKDRITGTPTQSGVFVIAVTADYGGGISDVQDLVFRIEEPKGPPVKGGIPTDLNIPVASVSLPLSAFFRDPDSTSAVQVSTNLGNFPIILNDELTPQTVANFNTYVNANDYNGVAVHRIVPGFVMQAGGFKPTAAASPDNNFTTLTRRPSPINEPGIQNVRGTVALAKVGGDPDSGTHDFFVSVADNTGNLDEQNRSFTVFGRVPDAQMTSVLDVMMTQPTGNYSIQLPTGNGTTTATQVLSSFPHTGPNNLPLGSDNVKPVDKNQLIRISSIAPTTTLSYSANSSNSAGVTAVAAGNLLTLTGLVEGEAATVTVTATDLDGNATQHSFNVTVSSAAGAVPSITTQPAGATVIPGASHTFTVAANGVSLPYQWRKNTKPIAGATGSSYTIPSVALADAGKYDVIVSNSAGFVLSGAVTLAVNSPPNFTKQPLSLSRAYRATATFTAAAEGPGTITYQWRFNGRSIPGATTASISVPAIAARAGNYQCIATNSFGSSNSQPVLLTVLPTDQDKDGLTDEREATLGTDAFVIDTDADGYPDGLEVDLSSDPKDKAKTPATSVVSAKVDREAILHRVAMRLVPGGDTSDILDRLSLSSTELDVLPHWLATYELTNAEFAAVLQHAKDVLGLLTISEVSGVKTVTAGGNTICSLPTHKSTAVGHLGVDEVNISADGSSFVVPVGVANHPVRGVTWWAAYLAAQVMNSFHGYVGKELPGNTFNFATNGFHIPRSWEWEWSAQGGTATNPLAYPTGSSIAPARANYLLSSLGKPRPVNTYTASRLGNFQLAGNVAEWVFETNAADAGGGYTRGGGYDAPLVETANNLVKPILKNAINPSVGIRLALVDPRSPLITSPGLPTRRLVATGNPLVLDAPSTGAPPRVYTWTKNGVVIKGQSLSPLRIPLAKLSDAGSYQTKVVSGPNSVTSGKTTVVTVEKVDRLITAPYNGTVTLKAVVSGTGVTYRWRKGGVNLADGPAYQGSETNTLRIIDSVSNESGSYDCLVSDASGVAAAVSTGTWNVLFVGAPIVGDSSLTHQVVGRTFAFLPSFETATTFAPSRWMMTGLPKGMSYDKTSGLIFGRATVANPVGKPYQIRVTAYNAKGKSETKTIFLDIKAFPANAVGDWVGNYKTDPEDALTVGGRFNLTTTSAATFTGSLVFEGVTHNIKGSLETQFDEALSGEAALNAATVLGGGIIPRRGKSTIRFGFLITPTTNLLEVAVGTYTDPDTTPSFYMEGNGWRNLWSTGTGTAQAYAGAMNVHLSLPSSAENNKAIPQGSGYATLRITNTGVTSLIGRAADGTTISSSGLLGPSGQVLLFHSPYGSAAQGNINGILTVTSGGQRPVTGTADWVKRAMPATSTERNYKAGFGPVTLTVAGALYTPPTGGNLVVNFPVTALPTNNAQATFSPLRLNAGGTALEGSVNGLCNISSTHFAAVANPVNLVALSITTSTGSYVGTVRIADGTVTREAKFYGLFVPGNTLVDVGKGYGHFLVPELPITQNTPPAANAPFISGRVIIDKQP